MIKRKVENVVKIDKYDGMKKVGISDDVIEITKKLDSMNQNIDIEKYNKMLKVEIPKDAIKYQTEFDNHKNKNKEISDKLKKI